MTQFAFFSPPLPTERGAHVYANVDRARRKIPQLTPTY